MIETLIAGIAASLGFGGLVTVINNVFLKKKDKKVSIKIEGKEYTFDLNDKEKIREILSQLVTPKVFISYHSSDKAFVERLVRDLQNNNIEVWYDESEIQIGENIKDKVSSAIKDCAYYMIIISENYKRSKFVEFELLKMLEQEKKENITKILPVNIDNSELPEIIQDRMYADFSKNYEDGLSMIIKKLSPAANK